MQITLTSKEFDEAVSLWLQDQGFSTNTHSISTRVIAGRTDSGAGTRVEVTLEPKPSTPVFEAMGLENGNSYSPADKIKATTMLLDIATQSPTTRRFGQGNINPEWKGTAEGGGHADE